MLNWSLTRSQTVALTDRQGSVLDAEEGIRFRGKTVSKTESRELLVAIPNKIADP